MTTKNYGAGVSLYNDPEGRGFETTVFRQGKPVLDHEQQLIQDAAQEAIGRLRKKALPSGWITGDPLEVRGGTTGTGYFTRITGTSLDLRFFNGVLRAHVNGWVLDVDYTNSNSDNGLTLSAAPAGAGAKRTDLVILEVWRRLLNTTGTGKSHTGRIWRGGNVKIRAADDGTLNYADDILDPNVGAETTNRVQIQFRLRLIDGVDLTTYPYGINDPTVVARSVPTAPASPDGTATVYTYTNQSSAGDPGLWIAGDGNPANALGTVDGYMYAIPLAAVQRRNSTAWNRNTNHNGGVATPGPSDRPDGLFHDAIDLKDIIDLRSCVNPTGWNYQEVLEKNFGQLLDNELLSEIGSTSLGGGVQGQYLLWADEIGITNGHGGDGTTTGDTPGAEFIGEFDAARRSFTDRYCVETITLRYVPTDGSGGGPNWTNNSVITIQPTSLPIYPYSAFNWAAYASSTASFVEIENATFIGSGATKDQAPIDNTYKVSGLGEVPATTLSFNIGTVPAGITDEPLFIRVLVAYPSGLGLTKTPAVDLGSNGFIINNIGQLPNSNPIWYEAVQTQSIDAPHRELYLTYRTTTRSTSFSVKAAGTTSALTMPERILSISSVTVNGGAYAGATSISSDGYTVNLTVALNPGDEITLGYKAIRPFPQNGEQITLFYYALAPQTAREGLLTTPFAAIPRYVSQHLYSMTIGSGSDGTAYPYPQQYVQMPGVYPTSGGTFSGDHELDGGALVLKNFSTEGGFAKIPAIIPMVANPDQFSFTRAPGDSDIEGRTYYKAASGGAYIPNAYGEPLNSKIRHRVMLPVLAELGSDSALGFKGQLVMVVIGLWFPKPFAPGAENAVTFNPTLASNITSMSVYRLKGNLLNGRAI